MDTLLLVYSFRWQNPLTFPFTEGILIPIVSKFLPQSKASVLERRLKYSSSSLKKIIQQNCHSKRQSKSMKLEQ